MDSLCGLIPQVILTTNLNPDTKTKLATDTFINFKDGDTSYGIKFSKPDIAALFQQTIENLKLPSTPNEVKNFSSSAPPLPPPLISRVSSNLPSTILPPPLTASEPPQTHGSCDITPPPPPPPPPPCSAASTSEVRGMESAPKKDDRINSGMDLSSALSAVKLRKPPAV
ncbi:hypothetical protein HZS_1561 [Henneguya salminicola]|nr:hypothetical protein HZS_1561 [Henneguya salminicola]